ncbi:MAG: DUF1576 domain-containing protein [Bacillota bacterium]|nr:DUF1576 domain-containing protein [Bacillota bacterium]
MELKQANRKILDQYTKKVLMFMLAFPIVFMLMGIILSCVEAGSVFGGYDRMKNGLGSILNSSALLITDFFEIGGIGPTLINVALISFFNLYLLYQLKMPAGGLMIAAFFTVIGFSFFGKTILNILPIYLGGYLYSKNQNIPFQNVFLVSMFATALAPMVSFIANSDVMLNDGVAQFMGMILGTAIGFIVMPLSSTMLKFHDGFNLYNVGFTAGIIGTVLTSILRSFNMVVDPVLHISTANSVPVILMMYSAMGYFIYIALRINPKIYREYHKIFVHKGRSITDFTVLRGYDYTFLNMGIMGIISITAVLLLGGVINGPIIAGIFTVVGFSAFGKHPKNALPIMIGVSLAVVFYEFDISSTPILMTMLFSTTLSPIAGTYGPIMGMVAGMIHLAVVLNIGIIQGGINLYNNGFGGGLVAAMILPIISSLMKESKKSNKW